MLETKKFSTCGQKLRTDKTFMCSKMSGWFGDAGFGIGSSVICVGSGYLVYAARMAGYTETDAHREHVMAKCGKEG
jgi:hypothetical protein